MKADTSTRLQTRTGINRDWGIVEESILYNREVFDEGTRFWGEVLLPDELVEDFKKFVKEANDENVIRVGTGRTRGLGRVSIDEPREGIESKATDFSDKLNRFDDAMQQQAHNFGIQPAPFYFAITLQASTILCDSFLRYQKTLEPTALAKLLGLPSEKYGFERVYQSVGAQRVTGWNELWGTPRSHDYALEMGSTFLFACTQKPDSDFLQVLQATEERGIGRRRAEGFGRLSFSDPFHLERERA